MNKEDKTMQNLYSAVYEIVGDQLKHYNCSDEFEDFLVDDIIDYIFKGTPQKIEKLYGIEADKSIKKLGKLFK